MAPMRHKLGLLGVRRHATAAKLAPSIAGAVRSASEIAHEGLVLAVEERTNGDGGTGHWCR
jgi:hypothetical protein